MTCDLPRPQLHVLQLTDNLKVGGVQRVVVNLTHMLAPEPIRISVAASPIGPLWKELSPGADTYHAPGRDGLLGKLRYVRWLRQTVRKSGCDVIHAHQRGVALSARIASIGTGVVVVEHVHSIFNTHKLLSFHGHLLIACGSSVADVLVRTYRKSIHKVRTVKNSVPDLTLGQTTPLPSAEGNLPRIIAIGRLTDVKDPLRFVRMVASLNSGRFPAADVVWIGDGELREEAELLARSLNCKNLRFLGNQDDVTDHIRESDLLVMTSKREGLPLAILETMSLGRGIIAPNIGSCGDAIIPGQNGILYDPDIDTESLAELVRQHLSPSTLAAWGAKSRQLYLKNFHPAIGTRLLLEVYDSAINHEPFWASIRRFPWGKGLFGRD